MAYGNGKRVAKRSNYKKVFSRRKPFTYKRTPMLYREPPQLETQFHITHRFRFLCSANSTTDILISDTLLSRLFVSCVIGSSNANEFIAAYKILQLEYWVPPVPPQGTISTSTNVGASITWLGGGLGADRTINAVSLSTDRPAYVNTRPPKNSQAAFWATGAGNSNNYFSINNSLVGSYIDLVIAFTAQLGTATVTTFAGVSTTTGFVLCRLDGAGGIWVAVPGGITGSIE